MDLINLAKIVLLTFSVVFIFIAFLGLRSGEVFIIGQTFKKDLDTSRYWQGIASYFGFAAGLAYLAFFVLQ